MTTTNALPPRVGQTSAATAREVIDFYRRATPRVLTTLIRTEYVGPTDHHGSRFRASDLSTGDQTTVASDYA